MPTVDKKYVSGIGLLDTRSIERKVVNIQNTVGLSDISQLLKRYKPTTQTVFYNYTNKPLWVTGISQGVITGSGTTNVSVITLTAGTSGNVRLGDLARFEDGSVGYVATLTPGANDVIGIKSVDTSNLTHVSGQNIFFFSNFVGEEGDSRTSQRRDLSEKYQHIHFFGESNVETELVRMTTTEIEVDGVPYFYQKDLVEKFLKHKAEVNSAFIQSKLSTGKFTTATSALTDPGAGGGQGQTQRGIDQYISSYGFSRNTDVAGTCDLDDVAKLIDLATAAKAELSFMVFGSNAAMRPLDDHLKGIGSSGVSSAQLNVNGDTIDFSVEKLSYSNADFQKMNLPIMNHPDLIASDIRKNLYFIPTGTVKALSAKDGSSAVENRLQIKYMKSPIAHNNQGSDIWSEYHDGAASPITPSGTKRVWKTEWFTAQAVEMFGPEHAGKMKVLA